MNLGNIYKRMAYKKIIFTLMIVTIYIVGCNITVPGYNAKGLFTLLAHNPSAAYALSMSGVSLGNLSIFSIGIGPWMSALILWRVLTVSKVFQLQNLTNKQAYKIKFILSMAIGIIQAIAIILQNNLNKNSSSQIINLIIVLLAGVAILIWLGNMNTRFGIGDSTVIVMVSMSRNWLERIEGSLFSMKFNTQSILTIVLIILIGMALTIMVITFFGGQLRLPIMHVMMNNKYANESYLPISVNPAGGMPFMYAFTIITLPQYMFYALKSYYPHIHVFSTIYNYLQLDNIVGLLLVIIIVLLLSYGFAYVNVDNQEIAKNMKENGDYFPNVYPGKNTEKFLSDKTFKMATVGAAFNILVIGGPMALGIYVRSFNVWGYAIPMWIMWIILMQQILQQFSSLYNRGEYKPFIKMER